MQTAEGDSRFSEVAVEFLGIDIPDYMGRDTELSDKFLDLDGQLDIEYQSGRNIVSKFMMHEEKEDTI